MAIPAAQDPSLGFAPGDHVCAFYSASRNVLDDIVVGYWSFRSVGDESSIVRHGVDIDEWLAAESELNDIALDYPHYSQPDRLPG